MAVLVAITLASRRAAVAERIWNRVLVILVASGFFTLLPTRLLPPITLNAYRLWVVILAATAISFFWRKLPVVPVVATVTAMLSPLMPILLVQLLVAHTWSNSDESAGNAPRPQFAATPAARPDSVPIFIFVFDEWSIKRTAVDGVFRPEYPNSRALGAQALTFSQAWSYSTRSYHSLPALLFQMDQRIQIGPGMTLWDEGGKQVPTSSMPSLLGRAKAKGYHTALQGFYLPYKRILGDQVEHERTSPVFPRGDTFFDSIKFSAVRNLQWIVEPFFLDARRSYEAGVQSRWWYTINHRILDETMQLIDAVPQNTIAFFHWPLPHGPFVLNEDGTYNGQYPSGGILDGCTDRTRSSRISAAPEVPRFGHRSAGRSVQEIGKVRQRLDHHDRRSQLASGSDGERAQLEDRPVAPPGAAHHQAAAPAVGATPLEDGLQQLEPRVDR
jgi:hypothetical protein